MRSPVFAAWAVLALGVVACGDEAAEPDSVDPALMEEPQEQPAADMVASEPTAVDQPAEQAQATPLPAPAQPVSRQPVFDEPWTPVDTGTVQPGMTRADVIATWGEPVAERQSGGWTYLYFRNGCEASCGTFDLVMLENDQVVDAIVRGPGHHFGGMSSSPTGRQAEFTPPSQPSGP